MEDHLITDLSAKMDVLDPQSADLDLLERSVVTNQNCNNC